MNKTTFLKRCFLANTLVFYSYLLLLSSLLAMRLRLYTAPLIVMSGSHARYCSRNFSLVYSNLICYVHWKSLSATYFNSVMLLSLSCESHDKSKPLSFNAQQNDTLVALPGLLHLMSTHHY